MFCCLKLVQRMLSTLPTQITQELLKKVAMNAHVNINSEIPIIVYSCNVFKNADGRKFHARLFSEADATKKEECLHIVISKGGKKIDVTIEKKNCSPNAFCEIDVPIFANVHVDAFDAVKISTLNCSDFAVNSVKDIITENIRCQGEILMHSSCGSIKCDGMLMGTKIMLETKKKQPIILDVATGVDMCATTEGGNISTNCVYVHYSLFKTRNGKLNLKNVHKHTKIQIEGKGFLQMVGTRAEFMICAENSILDLQLAYASGNSQIICNEGFAKICISDKIAKMVDLNINCTEIELDKSVESLQKFLDKDKKKLVKKVGENNIDKLTIETKGKLTVCQLMWINYLLARIAKNKKAKATV